MSSIVHFKFRQCETWHRFVLPTQGRKLFSRLRKRIRHVRTDDTTESEETKMWWDDGETINCLNDATDLEAAIAFAVHEAWLFSCVPCVYVQFEPTHDATDVAPSDVVPSTVTNPAQPKSALSLVGTPAASNITVDEEAIRDAAAYAAQASDTLTSSGSVEMAAAPVDAVPSGNHPVYVPLTHYVPRPLKRTRAALVEKSETGEQIKPAVVPVYMPITTKVPKPLKETPPKASPSVEEASKRAEVKDEDLQKAAPVNRQAKRFVPSPLKQNPAQSVAAAEESAECTGKIEYDDLPVYVPPKPFVPSPLKQTTPQSVAIAESSKRMEDQNIAGEKHSAVMAFLFDAMTLQSTPIEPAPMEQRWSRFSAALGYSNEDELAKSMMQNVIEAQKKNVEERKNHILVVFGIPAVDPDSSNAIKISLQRELDHVAAGISLSTPIKKGGCLKSFFFVEVPDVEDIKAVCFALDGFRLGLEHEKLKVYHAFAGFDDGQSLLFSKFSLSGEDYEDYQLFLEGKSRDWSKKEDEQMKEEIPLTIRQSVFPEFNEKLFGRKMREEEEVNRPRRREMTFNLASTLTRIIDNEIPQYEEVANEGAHLARVNAQLTEDEDDNDHPMSKSSRENLERKREKLKQMREERKARRGMESSTRKDKSMTNREDNLARMREKVDRLRAMKESEIAAGKAPQELTLEQEQENETKRKEKEELAKKREEEENKEVQLWYVRALLAKMTSATIDSVKEEFLSLKVYNSPVLSDIVSTIFEKAIQDPLSGELCANLITSQISEEIKATFVSKFRDAVVSNARATILRTKGLDDFVEKKEEDIEMAGNVEEEVRLLEHLHAMKNQFRRTIISTYTFIGHLFRLEPHKQLAGLIHLCVEQLLRSVKRPCRNLNVCAPDEVSIECGVWLMETTGKLLYDQKLHEIDDSFAILEASKSLIISLRLRDKIEQLLRLRANKWVTPNSTTSTEQIEQNHAEQEIQLNPPSLLESFSAFLTYLTPNMDQLEEIAANTDFLEFEFHKMPDVELSEVLDLIFEQAIERPEMCAFFASLCKHQVTKEIESSTLTFKFHQALLKRAEDTLCNRQMEEAMKEKQAHIDVEKDVDERTELEVELIEMKFKSRRIQFGSMTFMGHLFAQDLLSTRLIIFCTSDLLKTVAEAGNDTIVDEEAIECAVRLLRLCAPRLHQIQRTAEGLPSMRGLRLQTFPIEMTAHCLQSAICFVNGSLALEINTTLLDLLNPPIVNSAEDLVGSKPDDNREQPVTSDNLASYDTFEVEETVSENTATEQIMQNNEEQAKKPNAQTLLQKVSAFLSNLTPNMSQPEEIVANKDFLDFELHKVSENELNEVVDAIFEQAIERSEMCKFFAAMCKAQVIQGDLKATSTFYDALVKRAGDTLCNKQLDQAMKEMQAHIDVEKDFDERTQLEVKLIEMKFNSRRRKFGGMTFMGHLFAQELLSTRLIMFCTVDLLKTVAEAGENTIEVDEEAIECAVRMLKVCSPRLHQNNSTAESLVSMGGLRQKTFPIEMTAQCLQSAMRFVNGSLALEINTTLLDLLNPPIVNSVEDLLESKPDGNREQTVASREFVSEDNVEVEEGVIKNVNDEESTDSSISALDELADTQPLLDAICDLLDDLTEETMNSVVDQFLAHKVHAAPQLSDIVALIFDQAVERPHMCSLFARLCVAQVRDETNKSMDNTSKFRDYLALRVQDTLDRKRMEDAAKTFFTPISFSDLHGELRRRKFGSIEFISHLYAHGLISVRIILSLTANLLVSITSQNLEAIELFELVEDVKLDEEAIECALRMLEVCVTRLREEKCPFPLEQTCNTLRAAVRFVSSDLGEDIIITTRYLLEPPTKDDSLGEDEQREEEKAEDGDMHGGARLPYSDEEKEDDSSSSSSWSKIEDGVEDSA